MIRQVLGRACALYWLVRSRGRIRGVSFIMRRPSLVRVTSGAMIRIGRGVSIDRDARIVARSSLTIGEGAFIGKNSTVIAFAPLEIGARVLLGENVSIHTEDHGPAGDRDAYTAAPISIGDDAWLSAGVVVLKGVTIGAATTVGANAVVTKDLPAGVTAVGIPARVVGTASAAEQPVAQPHSVADDEIREPRSS